MDQRNLSRRQTKGLDSDFQVPLNLRQAQPLDVQLRRPDFEPSNPDVLSSLPPADVGRVERQEQIISFLDHILRITRSSAYSKQSMISELTQLDGKIRSFLVMAMSEDEGDRQKSMRTSIALCIR